jgi:4-hydroxythreonine-4-phosphate dehydrogenase
MQSPLLNDIPVKARRQPVIGITMGCPVGVGPEIVLRLLTTASERPGPVVVLGDVSVLRWCARQLGLKAIIVPWHPGMAVEAGTVPVLELSRLAEQGGDGPLAWGRPDERTGQAMARYIEEAVRLCLTGDLAAMVTCPIAKSSLNRAGYRFPGHTEMLAALCGCDDYGMMMAGRVLRVSLVTIHTSLASVAGRLNEAEILRLIRLTHRTLRRDFAMAAPRLAVAGLNPHAGEGGLFGREEEEIIGPALRAARAGGWETTGPLPPDTVFHKAAAGEFDAVVCMYHDQGLIPFKLLHFRDGVNVTMGLPIVRTSVDHGTAYDIAGRGLAAPDSLATAVQLAGEIAANRERFDVAN